ncbi:hypothetical protein [Planktothricoides raciborskii]|uniref:Inner membrane protein n=1 Tax=Planktothricoides raciborskii FACHB-1370 TaxID=2949576 RepID=A0ABR8EBB2_9CYAN|nr:hypothetical protein [Planktothricoides raciborskii]MBD2543682.1 hypothetical protein [Planktothricoides raciborskii FACHB-1370]MBD2582425.1 hypothetical protein [Planktothricoides raciborskii FACHB-1261]
MYSDFQGIPNLPDLTHPNELMEFGSQIMKISLNLAIFMAFLGLVIAVINFSIKRRFRESGSLREAPEEPTLSLQQWVENYFRILDKFPHLVLVLILVTGGFFLCSTLANRYHHWEQQRVQQVAATVSGDRLEQPVPKIRYTVVEPYFYYNWVDGKQVKVESEQIVNRYMAIAASNIDVTINQSTDVQKKNSAIYIVDFKAEYEVVNQLKQSQDFFFEFNPPYGYTLLQNFKVEQDGKLLKQINPGDYGFPFRLRPGKMSKFQVVYQAQGGPRWVYNANGESLSKFQLTALANFPKADFASGIIPTESKSERNGTRFTWLFEDNVSVKNPFGVFTATDTVKNTGILPRLLLLAPAVFLWWIMLLYFSVNLSLRDVAIAGGLFFACLLTLTYLSRSIDVKFAWSMISLVMLVLIWGLGKNKSAKLAAFMATIAGGILPIWGLIVPYSGLTLSLAGLLSAIWLAVHHWYGLNPKT